MRPCGCPPDANNHVEPEPDWIGDTPIMHGESERPVPGTSHMLYGYPSFPDMYCLCGHPPYQLCPAWLGVDGWGSGVMDLEIRAADQSGPNKPGDLQAFRDACDEQAQRGVRIEMEEEQ